MLFERIERELTAIEPWVKALLNQVELSWNLRDCWEEVESRQTHHCSCRFASDRSQKLPTLLLKHQINGGNNMAVDSQIIQKRIRIRIPKHYHQEPVISRLVSHYNLTVNITAAVLGANANGDGWFDLDVKGTNAEIESAMTYLSELDLEIWNDVQASIW